MHYGEALKRPFTDFKKLLIGVLLGMIPIVNFFTHGYLLECSRTAMKGRFNLPEWKNMGDLFVKGFFMNLISIIYFIPAVIIGLIIGFSTITKIFTTGTISSGNIWVMLSLLIIAVLTSYFASVAIITYSKNYRFKEAFICKEIFSKGFSGNFFLAFIVSIILYIIISASLYGLSKSIPLVGPGIILWVAGVISFTLLGEAYGKLH